MTFFGGNCDFLSDGHLIATRRHVSNLTFHVAVIQFKSFCCVSTGLLVNRPRKSGTNTRRSRSAKHLPLCAAITTIDIAPPATTAEGIFLR